MVPASFLHLEGDHGLHHDLAGAPGSRDWGLLEHLSQHEEQAVPEQEAAAAAAHPRARYSQVTAHLKTLLSSQKNLK